MSQPPTDRETDATSASLLLSLRANPDSAVWDSFVDRYQGLIEKWCRSFGLQDSDVADVSQNVLLSLSTSMQNFEYDPRRSFRAWLKTVTRHAWIAFTKQMQRPGHGHGDTAVMARLNSVEAREDLHRRLQEQYDTELTELAILRVRLRVQPRTWEAFRMTAVEGLRGAEVAKRLQMKVAHVYVAKSEVLKTIREEVQRLEPESQPGEHDASDAMSE